MGLLGSQPVPPTQYNGLRTSQAILGTTLPIIIGQQRASWSLLWYGDFTSAKAKQAGGSGLAKGGAQYVYSASVIGAVCMGNCTNFLGVWDSTGKFATDTYTESYTVAGPDYSYTPTYAATMKQDLGTAFVSPYSVTVNDYGSPGSTTYTGNQNVPLTYTAGSPAANQYTINFSTNTYTFSAANTGQSVVITYVVDRYQIQETELDVVPNSGPYQVRVQYQSEYHYDVGVTYYPSGVALVSESGAPSVGTYDPGGGTYQFNAGDAGQGITISYVYTDPDTDNNTSSDLNMTFFGGGLGQSPWSYLTSGHPEQALSYSEVAYVASSGLYLGYSPVLPQYNFEIIGNYPFGGGIPDACPSDAIEGVLTNTAWGVGFPSGYIDTSLQGVVRDYWCANNFFISALLTNQDSAMSIIGDWCESGQVFVSWDEGLLKFIPLGDTTLVANGHQYTPPTQPVVDLDDNDFVTSGGNDPVSIEQSPWQSRWNRTSIRWSVRTNDYNEDTLQVEDAASINQYGLMVEDAKDYQFITTFSAAQFAANMRLQRLQAIFTTYKFTLKSNFAFLSPGDIITITDGLLGTEGTMFGRTPVRITKMTDDPVKGIMIEAETFPWSVGASLFYNRQAQIPSNTNEAAQQDPGNTLLVVFEVPDEAQAFVGDTIYIFANGSNVNWGGCELWTSFDGTNYNYYGRIDTPGRIGVTTQYLAYHTDPDNDSTLIVNMQQSGAQLQSVTAASRDAFVSLSGLVSEGETSSPQNLATQGANFGSTATTGGSGSQGPLQVTAGTDNPNAAYLPAWTNPGNVTSPSVYATCAFALGVQQAGPNNSPIPGGAVYGGDWDIASISPNQLRTTDTGGWGDSTPNRLMPWGPVFQGLGFNIPSSATITGVTVNLGYVSQSTSTAYIANVSLYHTSAAIGTTKTPHLGFTPTTQTMTLGNSSDLWGATLTPAIVNDPTFGFGIQVWIGTNRVFVQQAYVTINYTIGSGITATASHFLEATFMGGGGFTIPTSGIGNMSGIVVNLQGYVSAHSGTAQPSLWAQILINGAPAGNPKQIWDGTVSFPTSSTPYALGTSGDNWGLNNLTAAQVNAQGSDPAFGVAFYSTMSGSGSPTATVDVNDVTMGVYWNAGDAGMPWTNSQNVGSATSYASCDLTLANNSVWLVAEGFQFTLPFGTVIQGIQVSFEGYTDDVTDAYFTVVPFYNGQRYGLAKNLTPTTTNTTYTLGTATDLWGYSGWDIDIINDPSFGLAFVYSGDIGAHAYIRNVRVTVTGSSAYDVELISYETATLVGQNTYALTSLRRGILGSYPTEHPAGATFVRMDEASFTYQVPAQYRGETLYIKALSFNSYGFQLQSLASVSADEILITSNSVGAIDAVTGALVTGTAAYGSLSIDSAVATVQGTYGVQNVPQGYALAQLNRAGTGIPTWTQIVTGGGGSGAVSNIYVIEQAGSFLAAPWDYVLVDTSGGTVTATLPGAAANPNTTIDIKKTTSDANTVTIIGTGTDTVEGASSLVIEYQGSSVSLASDGVSNWFVY